MMDEKPIKKRDLYSKMSFFVQEDPYLQILRQQKSTSGNYGLLALLLYPS